MSDKAEKEEKIQKISLPEDILENEGYVIETGKPIEITILENTTISG